jgi:hypothetical protein
MNISKTRIIACVKRDLKERYKSFPPELRDQAIEQLVPLLERLPTTWYETLKEPATENDFLITEIVRKALAELHPDLVDKAVR